MVKLRNITKKKICLFKPNYTWLRNSGNKKEGQWTDLKCMHIYDKVSKKKQWKSSPIYPVLVSVLQKVREGTCLIAQLM